MNCSGSGEVERATRQELREPAFVTPYLYKIVRHPQYLGWLLIFWGAPTMSAGPPLFAIGMSELILVAIRFEERDLVKHISERYQRYREAGAATRAAPWQAFSGLAATVLVICVDHTLEPMLLRPATPRVDDGVER